MLRDISTHGQALFVRLAEVHTALMSNNNLLFASALVLAAPLPFAANAAPSKPATKLKTAIQQTRSTPAKSGVLQQVKNGAVTIRLRRARWAESEEVLMWRGRGKQLTLWFDAVLDPQIVLPKGASPSDFIVNARLLDEGGRAVQVFPVDPVRSLHRFSLPYVPMKIGFKTEGQSVWRVQPFNPNFNAVKLQIEWLRPGHPFNRKTMPPSILESEVATPEAREWLQKLDINLPEQQIEYGAVKKNTAVANTPIAQGGNERFKAILTTWRKGTAKIISGDGAGTSHIYFEAALLLRATDPRDRTLSKPVKATLRNQAGENITMSRSIGEASQWFAPDGKPLKANEQVLSGSFGLTQPLNENHKWSLELQPNDGGEPLTLRDLAVPPGVIGAVK